MLVCSVEYPFSITHSVEFFIPNFVYYTYPPYGQYAERAIKDWTAIFISEFVFVFLLNWRNTCRVTNNSRSFFQLLSVSTYAHSMYIIKKIVKYFVVNRREIFFGFFTVMLIPSCHLWRIYNINMGNIKVNPFSHRSSNIHKASAIQWLITHITLSEENFFPRSCFFLVLERIGGH